MSQPPGGPATTPGKLAVGPLATTAEKLTKEPSLAQLWIRFDTKSRVYEAAHPTGPKVIKGGNLTGGMGDLSLGYSAGVAQGLERRSHNP